MAVQLSSQTLHVLLTCAGDFFQDLQPLVQSALDGYNVSIFSYGQTGSGKTHTMVNADFLLNIDGNNEMQCPLKLWNAVLDVVI